MDDQAIVLGDFAKIAMMPNAGEPLEIRSPIFFTVGVIPETNRHTGKGPGANQLAFFAAHRLARLAPHSNRQAQSFALNLAPPDR